LFICIQSFILPCKKDNVVVVLVDVDRVVVVSVKLEYVIHSLEKLNASELSFHTLSSLVIQEKQKNLLVVMVLVLVAVVVFIANHQEKDSVMILGLTIMKK
jgi:predicted type IV restriction endonuclease